MSQVAPYPVPAGSSLNAFCGLRPFSRLRAGIWTPVVRGIARARLHLPNSGDVLQVANEQDEEDEPSPSPDTGGTGTQATAAFPIAFTPIIAPDDAQESTKSSPDNAPTTQSQDPLAYPELTVTGTSLGTEQNIESDRQVSVDNSLQDHSPLALPQARSDNEDRIPGHIVHVQHQGQIFKTTNTGCGPVNNVGHIENAHFQLHDDRSLLWDSLPKQRDTSGQRNEYMEGSREGDMQKITQWIEDAPPGESVLWIQGPAGAGKSTLARHLTHTLRASNQLAGSVFLSAVPGDARGPEGVVKIMAREFGTLHPTTIPAILSAISASHGTPLRVQLGKCLWGPVQSLQLPRSLVFILDAIDEWESYDILLKELGLVGVPPSAVKFILLGRLDPRTRGFQDSWIRLHRLEPVSAATMGRYFEQELAPVTWGNGWEPKPNHISKLVELSDGLFIWAMVVCSLLKKRFSRSTPRETLEAILYARRSLGAEGGLAHLYHQAIVWLFPEQDDQDMLRQYLEAALVLQEPLPLDAFSFFALPLFSNSKRTDDMDASSLYDTYVSELLFASASFRGFAFLWGCGVWTAFPSLPGVYSLLGFLNGSVFLPLVSAKLVTPLTTPPEPCSHPAVAAPPWHFILSVGLFFANKGAVAGVFVVVSLILVGLLILLFVHFARRRAARRQRGLHQQVLQFRYHPSTVDIDRLSSQGGVPGSVKLARRSPSLQVGAHDARGVRWLYPNPATSSWHRNCVGLGGSRGELLQGGSCRLSIWNAVIENLVRCLEDGKGQSAGRLGISSTETLCRLELYSGVTWRVCARHTLTDILYWQVVLANLAQSRATLVSSKATLLLFELTSSRGFGIFSV
ncbi:hypothetical protein NMY22_g17139 [Coprinellus aureogranulatus]|nr:hypothetical protein NMY22_g17139 [Coprinellus aureogranulatus]